MKSVNNNLGKYNITIKKLIDAILKLSKEQQSEVMFFVEELLDENKRASVRKPCRIPVSYSSQNHIFSDNISDISHRGLFIETKRSLNVGEELVLSFNKEGYDRPFKIKGEIVRSTREGLGVEFKEVMPYISQMLGALVERLKR